MNNNNTETLYAHRPKSGISLAARKVDDTIFVALALTNNGYNRKGELKRSKIDNFSRRHARGILNNRLNHAAKGEVQVKFTTAIFSDSSIQEFMKELRSKLDAAPVGFMDGPSRFADGIVDYVSDVIQYMFSKEIEEQAVKSFQE